VAAKAARRGPGGKLGGWRLEEQIGKGGNGTVWRVSKPGSPDCALKLLRNLGRTALVRFAAEIEGLKRAVGIDGVIPLLEHELPHGAARDPRWFVMPLAEKLETWLS